MLAVSDEVFSNVFRDSIGAIFLENNQIKLLVFNIEKEVVSKWID